MKVRDESTSVRPLTRFRLTKGGLIFVLYTVAVGAGAINTGNNLLYLIFGTFLGLLVASWVLSSSALRRLEASVRCPAFGEAREPAYLGFSLTNRKSWLPSVSLTATIEGDLSGEPVRLKKFIAAIRSGGRVASEAAFHPLRRGIFRPERLIVATGFPFGLIRKARSVAVDHAGSEGLIVYPRRLAPDWEARRWLAASREEGVAAERRGEGATIDGIRAFRDNDNPKRIHWKATAKRDHAGDADPARWLVREMATDESVDAWLRWPGLDRVTQMAPAEQENFIAFTADLVRALEGGGRRAGLSVLSSRGLLVVDPARARLRGRPVLEFLAVVDASRADGGAGGPYLIAAPDPRRAARGFDVDAMFRSWAAREGLERRAE